MCKQDDNTIDMIKAKKERADRAFEEAASQFINEFSASHEMDSQLELKEQLLKSAKEMVKALLQASGKKASMSPAVVSGPGILFHPAITISAGEIEFTPSKPEMFRDPTLCESRAEEDIKGLDSLLALEKTEDAECFQALYAAVTQFGYNQPPAEFSITLNKVK